MYPLYNFGLYNLSYAPKNRRIPRKEFPSIILKGKRTNSPSLLLYMMSPSASKGGEASRFSFSVSKKVYPKAVDRNKYRRRGYAVISNNINRIKPGYFFFFSFKKTAKPASFLELEKEILGLLSQYGVIS